MATEFQKKTFDKVKSGILSFLPDGEMISNLDVWNIISHVVDKLSDREVDALMLLGEEDLKRNVVVQRFYDLFIGKYFEEEGKPNES